MSFAPHHNGEVTKENGLRLVRGGFRTKGRRTGSHPPSQIFEYTNRDDTDFAPDFPHMIAISHLPEMPGGGSPWRYAKVLKTRVHVVVDEDSEGNPVVETWPISGHRKYDVTKYESQGLV